MKEHPDIVKFFHFSAYVRTRLQDSKGAMPLAHRLWNKAQCVTPARGVHASRYARTQSDCPNASYRVTTKFAQSELDSAKQKAGYHYHSDTLPLLVTVPSSPSAEPPIYKKRTRTLFVKNRVRVRTVWWAIQDLNPGPSGYEPPALTN